ncbi:MAG: glycosyltransferase [Rickettsiales bacterium]|jgi:glycosyltransferase involved in cell wall biosynthesis|nr:glycosyltransferase [Rickettsiales bacterium]
MNSDAIKISVIMPAYNAQETIADSIRSVLNQTFSGLELIIVNDGSTDKTVSEIARHTDPRIVLINKEHSGISESLNIGIKRARANLIARHDADDIMRADRLEKQFHFMNNNPDIAICSSWMNIIGSGTLAKSKTETDDLFFELQFGNCIFHPTTVIRKDFLTAHNLEYGDFPAAEDYKLWCDIAKNGGRHHCIAEPLTAYRVSDKSVSATQKDIQLKSIARINELFFPDILTSVIIPAFNVQDTIFDTIQSVISQTLFNTEIIIVDDGSTDKTVSEIARHTDPRIRLIKLPHKNANVARNAGIQAARGRYIAFLDADDSWVPEHLEESLRVLMRDKSDGVYGDLVINQKQLVPARLPGLGEPMINFLLRVPFVAQTSTWVMTADSVRDILWDEQLERYQDLDFLARYHKKYKLSILNKQTVHYFLHQKKYKINVNSVISVLEKHKSDISENIRRAHLDGIAKGCDDKNTTNWCAAELAKLPPERTVFFMNISNSGVSGVVRYLDELQKELQIRGNVIVRSIKIIVGRDVFFRDNGNEYIIGINQVHFNLLDSQPEFVWHMIRHLFDNKQNIILHLHTLNLMGFAEFIRGKSGAKIISHLHCMPWKSYFNSNPAKFNKLYKMAQNGICNDEFIVENFEKMSYLNSDKLICCTKNGADFSRNLCGAKSECIYNGIADRAENFAREYKTSGRFNLLFTGSEIPSKGLHFIVEAVAKVIARGYDVRLDVAGAISGTYKKKIDKLNLPVNILGTIEFDKLCEYYKSADIGIIASLQEQCSYAAIEMMSFGLPIITTDIDGLGEIFAPGTAVKISPVWDEKRGLRVDTNDLADKIIGLINDKNQRVKIGECARRHYLNNFTAKTMADKITAIYDNI